MSKVTFTDKVDTNRPTNSEYYILGANLNKIKYSINDLYNAPSGVSNTGRVRCSRS